VAEDNPLPPDVTRERALELASEAMRGTLSQLHGGATATLCETVGSFGTAILVGPERRLVGIQLSVNHLRGARDGHVTCTGVPLRVGRRVAVWDLRVEDDDGGLVATATLTVAIRAP
jgi:1,4-dihydroxy-2-naphthoyl-CoA hydrolase